MLNKDIDKLLNAKEDDILDLTIGKVRVIKNYSDCGKCYIQQIKDDSYMVNCHHFCCSRPNIRSYHVTFIKEK